MARRAQAVRKGGGFSGGRLIIAAIVAAALAVTALPLCVLFAAGMLPSAVAAMVDRHRLRYLTASVALLNLAGMVVPVFALLKLQMTVAGALHVLSDQRNWLIMYSAAGIGWILYSAMPVIARVMVDFQAQRDEHRLVRRVAQLVAEWGSGLGQGEG
jgi:hypothetical protein